MEQHEVEIEVYEAPAMVEAGDFAEVTLGGGLHGAPDSSTYFRS
ncbi:lasso RiPP family leader peptide-containing protein [Streptomyces olivaceus]